MEVGTSSWRWWASPAEAVWPAENVQRKTQGVAEAQSTITSACKEDSCKGLQL